MRAAAGVLSLLVALAVVAVLAKKQFATPPATSATASALRLSPQQQSNQAQQQYKKALDGALQQPRLLQEDQKND